MKTTLSPQQQMLRSHWSSHHWFRSSIFPYRQPEALHIHFMSEIPNSEDAMVQRLHLALRRALL